MKRNKNYICNRCGKVIDTEHELDCIEIKAFQYRSISNVTEKIKLNPIAEHDSNKFERISEATKFHYCSDCMDMLMKYVYGYELKSAVSEEIIRCRDCKKYLRDCPIEYRGRNDFFCGYGERKE